MMNGRYTQCYECAAYTPAEDDRTEPYCDRCSGRGDDPGCGVMVEVIDCPDGDPEACQSEDHHWGMHKHVKELEQ